MKKLIPLIIATLAISALAANAADAKTNYDKPCAKCHGKEGKGDT
jgi:cytochrome c553